MLNFDVVTVLQYELEQMDERLLLDIDEKVADQQATMQSAGVPGFFVTNDPKVS